jgi:hypothetical protein
MLVLGVGICLNNTIAVIRGLYLEGGEFVRTPKSGSLGRVQSRSRYAVVQGNLWLIELILAVYCFFTFVFYLTENRYFFSFFLFLYGFGFLVMGLMSRPQATPPEPPAAPVPQIA